MIENNRSSGRRAGSRHASEKPTWSVTLAIRKVTLHASARPPSLPKDVRETDSRRHHSRHGVRTGGGDRRNMGDGKQFIPAGKDCG